MRVAVRVLTCFKRSSCEDCAQFCDCLCNLKWPFMMRVQGSFRRPCGRSSCCLSIWSQSHTYQHSRQQKGSCGCTTYQAFSLQSPSARISTRLSIGHQLLPKKMQIMTLTVWRLTMLVAWHYPGLAYDGCSQILPWLRTMPLCLYVRVQYHFRQCLLFSVHHEISSSSDRIAGCVLKV